MNHERRPVIAGEGEKSVTIWIPRQEWLDQREREFKARWPEDPRYRPDLPATSPENESFREFIRVRAALRQDQELASHYSDNNKGLAAHPYSSKEFKEKLETKNRALRQQTNQPRPETRKTPEQYAKLAWDWAKEMALHKPGGPEWYEVRDKAYQFKRLCLKRASEDGTQCPALPNLAKMKKP